MATSWDVFFSYRRHDLDRAQPLLKALAEAGVRVWRDENDIPDQASITSEIRDGIANCKALLAFYSLTGVYGQAAAQVRGLGGNGKSLLAREYSIRFGPAYPGGVFWLNAYGHDDTKGPLNPEQREALRQDQIREFAIRSGVPTEGLN